MKLFLVIVAMVWAGAGYAADQPAAVPASSLSGKVLEVKHADSYTYLRLKTKDGEMWAATSRAAIAKGAEVQLDHVMVMTNFQSKALNRKFDQIVFGDLAGAGGSTRSADMAAAHAGVQGMPGAPAAAEVKVAKATGANARTVAEVITGKTTLKDKPVLIRGKVVKYNPGILGRNWIHLADGTGTAAARTNDVLVTSSGETKVGAVVLVKGTVRTDQDFGAGYAYPVMIEATELSGK